MYNLDTPSLFLFIEALICFFVALCFFYYLLRPVTWGGGVWGGKGGSIHAPLSQYIDVISFDLQHTRNILTLFMTGVAGTCDSDPSS